MTTQNNLLTAGAFLQWATKLLTAADIPTARLDSLILMEDTLATDRAHILAYLDQKLSSREHAKLAKSIEQRAQHMPLAYLRGKVMFYGRTFFVTQKTLIPRPESEDSIDLIKKYLGSEQRLLSLADIGTGSGCLGISAALELKNCTVDLYDIDTDALEIAKRNARRYKIAATYIKEDLLTRAHKRKYDAIIANLPYVPEQYPINQDAQFEPRLALFAGKDGLLDYERFWHQLADFLVRPTYVITESFPNTQHQSLAAMAANAGYELAETREFIQLFKLSS
jgi:release factor glutamine methyltransferase